MMVMVHNVVVVVHDVVVVDRVVHDVVVVMDRRGGQGRDGGETDTHRRGDQQFLKHSLSP